MYKIRAHKRYKAVSYIVVKDNEPMRMFRTVAEAVYYTTSMLFLDLRLV